MTESADLAGRYYRLGLAAAQQRNVSLALRYAERACMLEALGQDDAPLSVDVPLSVDMPSSPDAPPESGARRLAEICRYELGEDGAAFENAQMERVGVLAGEKKWRAAAEAAKSVAPQSVRLLNIQGCLWVLANRYAQAADCFTKALAKDRGNRLATEALVEIGKRRPFFWRFF